MKQHLCPVKGHNHELSIVKDHTQVGTKAKANTWACPEGRYRWFVLEGRAPTQLTRMIRPRGGWKND